MKYIREVREKFRKSPAFTMAELRLSLGKKGISSGYLKTLRHNLLASGELRRITRGIYTFREDVEVVGFGFKPFYYGLQEALSLMNVWAQETNPVVITPRKVRGGVREFCGGNYVVKRVPRRMFFGFRMMKYKDMWVPVSDPEKTLIDFIYFDEPLNAEIWKELTAHIDYKKLQNYVSRCPTKVLAGISRAKEVLRAEQTHAQVDKSRD